MATNLGRSTGGGGTMYAGGSADFDESTGRYRSGRVPTKPGQPQPIGRGPATGGPFTQPGFRKAPMMGHPIGSGPATGRMITQPARPPMTNLGPSQPGGGQFQLQQLMQLLGGGGMRQGQPMQQRQPMQPGMMYPGGSATFDEGFGGGRGYLGGSPNFDERTGQYRNQDVMRQKQMLQRGQVDPNMMRAMQQLFARLGGGGQRFGAGPATGQLYQAY